MKLYHFPYSTNARKVRMATLLLGIDVEVVNVDLGKGEQHTPADLAINPMGRVPVLDDNGFVLWESHAIMAYLVDAKKPGNALYPAEPRARADVNRWLFWAASHWGPAISGLNVENVLKAMFKQGDPDPVQVKRQEDYVRTFGAVLDAHLAKREWVSGPALTIADLAIACPLMSAARARVPVDSFANLQAWFSRVKALEAWQKTEPPPAG